MKTLKFGLEIETVGQPKEVIARAIQSVVGGTTSCVSNGSFEVLASDQRIWKVVHDGSLSGSSSRNGEIVSPVLNYEDIPMIQEVIRVVRQAHCRCDSSCGIHVHVSIDQFDVRAFRNVIKSYNKHEQMIDAIFQVGPARKARYCKGIDQDMLKRIEKRISTMRDLNEAWYGYHNPNPNRYDLSRYSALNANSAFYRGTLEFRAFNAVLHAGKVKSIIHFVLAFCAKAIKSRATSSKKKPFNPATARYDARVLALHLGLIGDEYKVTRKHLISHLEGSAAWKHGRPERRQDAA